MLALQIREWKRMDSKRRWEWNSSWSSFIGQYYWNLLFVSAAWKKWAECIYVRHTSTCKERESKVGNFTVIVYNTMTFSWRLYADSNKGILNNTECIMCVCVCVCMVYMGSSKVVSNLAFFRIKTSSRCSFFLWVKIRLHGMHCAVNVSHPHHT